MALPFSWCIVDAPPSVQSSVDVRSPTEFWIRSDQWQSAATYGAKADSRSNQGGKSKLPNTFLRLCGYVFAFLFFLADSWHFLVILGTHDICCLRPQSCSWEPSTRSKMDLFMKVCMLELLSPTWKKKISYNYWNRNFEFLKSNISCFCMKFYHLAKRHYHSHACLYCIALIISHICMREKKYGSLHCSVLHPQFNT